MVLEIRYRTARQRLTNFKIDREQSVHPKLQRLDEHRLRSQVEFRI
jgi:hypothetical protein